MLLAFSDGDGGTKYIKLKPFNSAPQITIGRSKHASVTFDDNSCSRIHCAIRYWEDIFIVRDMNSRNGTLVNDQKIKIAPLEPGDVLKVGDLEFTAYAEKGSSIDVTISP